jgi:hypothetical protein
MVRTKSFKFRVTPAERLEIARLALLARRSESDYIRRLIEEAVAAISLNNPEDNENKIDRSSSTDRPLGEGKYDS